MSARHECWECGGCGQVTSVRHWLQREGVMVHDPDAAFREAAGLDEPEPSPAETDRVQAVEAAEDHADQTAFDAWRERGL